jgi:hypothetical protein
VAQSQAELQTLLREIEGVTEAYFQKPGNLTLTPPYIVYEIDDEYVARADDTAFAFWNRYTVTIVDRDPDSPIRATVRDLPHASMDRKFISGGLYHFVYNLYF